MLDVALSPVEVREALEGHPDVRVSREPDPWPPPSWGGKPMLLTSLARSEILIRHWASSVMPVSPVLRLRLTKQQDGTRIELDYDSPNRLNPFPWMEVFGCALVASLGFLFAYLLPFEEVVPMALFALVTLASPFVRRALKNRGHVRFYQAAFIKLVGDCLNPHRVVETGTDPYRSHAR